MRKFLAMCVVVLSLSGCNLILGGGTLEGVWTGKLFVLGLAGEAMVFEFRGDSVTVDGEGPIPWSSPAAGQLDIGIGSEIIRCLYKIEGDKLFLALSFGGARPSADQLSPAIGPVFISDSHAAKNLVKLFEGALAVPNSPGN